MTLYSKCMIMIEEANRKYLKYMGTVRKVPNAIQAMWAMPIPRQVKCEKANLNLVIGSLVIKDASSFSVSFSSETSWTVTVVDDDLEAPEVDAEAVAEAMTAVCGTPSVVSTTTMVGTTIVALSPRKRSTKNNNLFFYSQAFYNCTLMMLGL